VPEMAILSGSKKDSVGVQRFRFYSSLMNAQFSAKRTIDQLKFHLVIYLREVLQESKMSAKQIRLWSTNQTELVIV
jgi:hypothetical protein